MTASNIIPARLVYNGEVIHDRGEMVSLTDMWKAAGSPSSKRPANWSRKDGADFIAHVSLILNMPDGHISTQRGANGGTFAHWQIALAYAKYLSPEFHMWCNTAVRQVMEHKPTVEYLPSPVDHGLIGRQIAAIVQDKLSAAVEKLLPPMVERAMAADARVAALEYVSVRELLDEAKALSKGRNRVNRKIGFAMRNLALTSNPPAALRRCPHSGVWLYPRGFAAKFMASAGNVLVKEHNDRVTGQGVLKLVRGTAPQTSETAVRS